MIVILENVISAPWETMVDSFEEIGYSAQSTKSVVQPTRMSSVVC